MYENALKICLSFRFLSVDRRTFVETIYNKLYAHQFRFDVDVALCFKTCHSIILRLNNDAISDFLRIATAKRLIRCDTMVAELQHKCLQSDFSRMYSRRMKSTLAEAQKACVCREMDTSIFHRYTFQIVMNVSVCPQYLQKANKKKVQVVDGRMLKRMFVCLPNAAQCLHFFMNWMQVQQSAIEDKRLYEISTLMECGILDEEKCVRKWIVDIDASLKDLHAKGLIAHVDKASDEEVSCLHGKVLEYASSLSLYLYSKRFTSRPTCYTVLTRHSDVKLSWHVTLNALATHEVWRTMLAGAENNVKNDISNFVDKSTLNNSKSQYMQTYYSTKIKETPIERPTFFVYDGVYDYRSEKLTDFNNMSTNCCQVMRYATSSMMIQDPWCVRCMCVLPMKPTSLKMPKHNQVKATTRFVEAPGLWDQLPSSQLWMKEFIETVDSKLSFIPSMRHDHNMCKSVLQLLAKKQCEILVHAYVHETRLCPRIFKACGRVHVHSNNRKCVVTCIRLWNSACPSASEYRMFIYCLSSKCKKCAGDGWTEITHDDFIYSKRIKTT
jgi:hypothetical protein